MTARDDSDGLARRVMADDALLGTTVGMEEVRILARAVVEIVEASAAAEAMSDRAERGEAIGRAEWDAGHDRYEAAWARLLLLAGGAGTARARPGPAPADR